MLWRRKTAAALGQPNWLRHFGDYRFLFSKPSLEHFFTLYRARFLFSLISLWWEGLCPRSLRPKDRTTGGFTRITSSQLPTGIDDTLIYPADERTAPYYSQLVFSFESLQRTKGNATLAIPSALEPLNVSTDTCDALGVGVRTHNLYRRARQGHTTSVKVPASGRPRRSRNIPRSDKGAKNTSTSGPIPTHPREEHITSLRKARTEGGEGLDCLTAGCQPIIVAPTLASRAMHVMLVWTIPDPWGCLHTRRQNKGEREGGKSGEWGHRGGGGRPVDIKPGAWDPGPKKLSVDVW